VFEAFFPKKRSRIGTLIDLARPLRRGNGPWGDLFVLLKKRKSMGRPSSRETTRELGNPLVAGEAVSFFSSLGDFSQGRASRLLGGRIWGGGRNYKVK